MVAVRPLGLAYIFKNKNPKNLTQAEACGYRKNSKSIFIILVAAGFSLRMKKVILPLPQWEKAGVRGMGVGNLRARAIRNLKKNHNFAKVS